MFIDPFRFKQASVYLLNKIFLQTITKVVKYEKVKLGFCIYKNNFQILISRRGLVRPTHMKLVILYTHLIAY